MNANLEFFPVISPALTGANVLPLTGIAMFVAINHHNIIQHSGLAMRHEGLLVKAKCYRIQNAYPIYPRASRHDYWCFVKIDKKYFAYPYELACNNNMDIVCDGWGETTNNYDYMKYYDGVGYVDENDYCCSISDECVYHRDDACYCEVDDDYYSSDACVYGKYLASYGRLEEGYFLERDSWTSDGTNKHYHESVYKNTCEACNNNYHSSESDYSDYCCDDCYDSSQESESMLDRHNYHTNVLRHHGFGTSKQKINGQFVYLGVELELLANDDSSDCNTINNFSNENDFCIATEDGSLDENLGVEFVFNPQGLPEQKENVQKLFDEIGDCLDEYVGSEYGLHIHISRHFISELSALKIQNFVSAQEKFFRSIGGRSGNGYQTKKHFLTNASDLKCKASSRYNMVNLTNDATIEFRYPVSTHNVDQIGRNLELVHACTMFCCFNLSLHKTNVANIEALELFKAFIVSNKKTYPLLTSHLANV